MGKYFFILAVCVTVVSGICMTAVWYPLYRDTDSLIDRAQVAAKREDMVEYISSLKENMEGFGMIKGHTVLIFKTPINDMSLHYKTVNSILERLEAIGELGQGEIAYQVALDDLRGVIRELPNPASGWLWVKYGWWTLLINCLFWGLWVKSPIKYMMEF